MLPKRIKITVVLAIANYPDKEGIIFSKNALQILADSNSNYWMDGDKLMGEFEIDDHGLIKE